MKNKIDSFIADNHNKKIVVVQGLGFVGAVMSLVVANSDENEYAVIGLDLPSKKSVIDALNNGEFPIKTTDDKVYEYFKNARKRNTFYATSDNYAYTKADVVIVDINLDVVKEAAADQSFEGYSVNMNGFKEAMRTIASRCKQDVMVLVETTVPPGTSQKIVRPIFEEEFKKRGLAPKFKIGHSYERVMPGPGYVDSIKNFYRVFSGINEESADAVEKFLHTIITTDKYPLTRLGNTNATEMSKVLENSFRAMNIAFIQEWTEFAESAGVNLHEVINAIRMRPTHQNIMRPGLGVGGYCLTKDPLLASWASQELFCSTSLNQFDIALSINDRMPLHTYKTITKHFGAHLSGKKLLMLGVSYLQNVGDTRHTPVGLLYDKLEDEGVKIVLHDPFVPYWPEKDVNIDLGDNAFEGTFDAVVIGTPHDIYLKEGKLDAFLTKSDSLVVFDSHGVIGDDLRKKHNNHEFKIIGRGDV
jgi:UDP-N-acetyl-D-glucosamine dehydrogenase